MEKRRLKIAFTDFWDNFDEKDNFFVRLLSERYEIEFSDRPDYLFYSVFGSRHLDYDCVKIFYTGENQAPDFNLCDYALGFEHLECGDRYFRLPIWYLYENDTALMERKHLGPHAEREGFCGFVYSNDKSSPERNLFFDRLSAYRQVSSGGRFRNNVGGPVADKQAFLQGFRFSIAFENTSHPGYATEKIVQAFSAGTIPIYWGDPRIAETFNPGAFVNCHDYPSWDAVVEAVKAIDEDPARCRAILETPALADPQAAWQVRREALLAFLDAIFSQTPQAARRFSREYWGERYRQQALIRERAYKRSLRGLGESLYEKTLWRTRRKNGLLWRMDRLLKRK